MLEKVMEGAKKKKTGGDDGGGDDDDDNDTDEEDHIFEGDLKPSGPAGGDHALHGSFKKLLGTNVDLLKATLKDKCPDISSHIQQFMPECDRCLQIELVCHFAWSEQSYRKP